MQDQHGRGSKLFVPRRKPFQGQDLPSHGAPPPPRAEPCFEKLKKLKHEVELSNDPLRTQFLCMLDAMENGREDRVIFWDDIAPDDKVVAPFFARRLSPLSKRFRDSQALNDNIKTWQDVAALPLGDGIINPRTFVVSFHKFLCETAEPSLFALRTSNDSFNETRETLNRWANVGVGGRSSMMAAYRAIKEFVRLGESNPGSVLSCIATTGTAP